MELNWNNLHHQSREEICLGACVSVKLASKSWDELEPWLQELLIFSFGQRTLGRVGLGIEKTSSKSCDPVSTEATARASRCLTP